ncbi:MAG: hypothetical protein LUF33_02800 [Clostridiales bacterium]|nr:hypothetical protein [Clostridiales bacterium]
MIVYYALTTYHIQCCVLHKITRKADEKAVLLLSDIHRNSVAFLPGYKESGIFDDVIILEETAVNNRIKQNERKLRSKRSILSRACRDIKKALPFDIKKADEIYLCPDHFPTGWYVIKNKIKYHCFEEGCGGLSDNEFMLSNMKRNKTQYALMNTLGYFGSNSSAVEILADTQSQKDGYVNEKMTDFSVKRILSSLNKKQLDKVLEFFGVSEKVDDRGTLSLILTQHMANLGIMSLENQHLLYKLFADYFLSGTHITVKPHPDDIAGRYDEIFLNEATVLPFAMPSELLPYIFEGRVKTAVAANSTAVKNLGDFCDRMICFDNRIMSDFKHIHKYFATLALIEHLGLANEKIVTNADELLLEELGINDDIKLNIQTSCELSDIENAAVISDEAEEQNSVEDICGYLLSGINSGYVIFPNENNKHMYFDGIHKEIFKFIRPVFIDLRDKGGCITKEVIYLYSTDSNILKKAENIALEKELKYTGVTLDIHSVSKSDREKIRMLESVLEATEKRLNEYIENKKLLDEEIAELKERKR